MTPIVTPICIQRIANSAMETSVSKFYDKSKIKENGGKTMARIENWKMSKDEIQDALQLQAIIKDAGISWPQLDMLLEVREGTVHEWCRGHSQVPRGTMERIKEILDGVKQGKIKPPIVRGED